jgi:hypothetical protein
MAPTLIFGTHSGDTGLRLGWIVIFGTQLHFSRRPLRATHSKRHGCEAEHARQRKNCRNRQKPDAALCIGKKAPKSPDEISNEHYGGQYLCALKAPSRSLATLAWP